MSNVSKWFGVFVACMGAEEVLTRMFFPTSPMWVWILVTLCGIALVAFGYWWERRSAKRTSINTPIGGGESFEFLELLEEDEVPIEEKDVPDCPLSLKELSDLCRSRPTSVAQGIAVEPYLGKRLDVSGRIEDVSRFDHGDRLAYLSIKPADVGDVSVQVIMSPDFTPAVIHLRPGTELSLRGTLLGVERFSSSVYVQLKNGQMLPPENRNKS